jgi:formate-nitrite transporter family protein
MPDETHKSDEGGPLPGLSEDEVSAVAERKAGSPKVVHEVIRLQGDEELSRSLLSLLSSGFAAGVSICASLMGEAFLTAHLPKTEWAPLVTGFGYTIGFVITIMGNLQLFTESTITVVLPIATHPTARNLARLVRLWTVALFANLAGTLFVAYAMVHVPLIGDDQFAAMIGIAQAQLAHDPLAVLVRAIPAGFLVASIAWIMPNARGGEFWLVVLITYLIALGGFSHVVVGSEEAWLLWLDDKTSLWNATVHFLLPALAGNIIGGTGLFAVLAHGQVRQEITESADKEG